MAPAAALAAVMLTAACGSAPAKKSPSIGSLLAAGIAAQQRGDASQARHLYTEVLAKQPTNFYAHYDLGVLDQAAGQDQEALSEYAQALRTNSRYVPALFNEATIYAASNPTEAIKLYEEVISVQPVAPTAYLNLGLLEVSAGQRTAGLRHLLVALHQDPTLIHRIPRDLVVPLSKLSTSPTPSASSSP